MIFWLSTEKNVNKFLLITRKLIYMLRSDDSAEEESGGSQTITASNWGDYS